MVGDFNIVLSKQERSREHFSRVCANELVETLDKLELLDLTLMGGKLTWSNQRFNPSCLKIDLLSFWCRLSWQLQLIGLC